jgi:hypothetical protein
VVFKSINTAHVIFDPALREEFHLVPYGNSGRAAGA